MAAIPQRFARTITEVHGAAGAAWLERLPRLIAELERRWSLDVGPPVANLSYNYVAPAVRHGGELVMLKLGVPQRELATEIEALRLYDGNGVVRLLEADPNQGALLLERLEPGTPLTFLADDVAATAVAADVMRRMWRPAPAQHRFPTVADWARGMSRLRARFDGRTGPLPAALVEEAETLFAGLLGSMAEPVLLHGDLHHDNILAARRQPWLAIDPKGVVGEPAYETGALLRNPMPQLLAAPDPGRMLARRIAQLADELGLDRARVRGWAVAQAVLSAWWSIEDHGRVGQPWITCAELLSRIRE